MHVDLEEIVPRLTARIGELEFQVMLLEVALEKLQRPTEGTEEAD